MLLSKNHRDLKNLYIFVLAETFLIHERFDHIFYFPKIGQTVYDLKKGKYFSLFIFSFLKIKEYVPPSHRLPKCLTNLLADFRITVKIV